MQPRPLPRLLVIMGSGETSPTMSKVHRDVFARLAPDGQPVPAVVLDTPFGFQENADDLAAKAVAYFRESVNREITVASFRAAEEIGSLDHESALSRVRAANWVFSGPGSPSYALAQWRGSQIPVLLEDKLHRGGCVVFASAAAVTLGAYAVPVYEVYKVGAAPHWLEGLDLLSAAGMRAAVIPHFNNAEGGTHDTRYCYMGERRLRMLEDQLPEDVFVLGVDEHTALVLDLDAGSASVYGLGVVTVRRRGRMAQVPSGKTLSIACLTALAHDGLEGAADSLEIPSPPTSSSLAGSPLLDQVAAIEASFGEALAKGDGRATVACILELDGLLLDWSRDSLQSDELDRGRAALRSMVVRLGEAAQEGLHDRRDVVGPFVDALLDARRSARSDRRWEEADQIRNRLLAAGIEVRDTPGGTEWRVG